MGGEKIFYLPDPLVDNREAATLDVLSERSKKLMKPSKLGQVGAKIGSVIPKRVKEIGTGVKSEIIEQKVYKQTMELIASGFKVVEEQAAKFSITEKAILKKINGEVKSYEVTELKEICFARSYEISKVVNTYKSQDLLAAFIEGGVTGVAGFAGLPFNIVMSTFLYFRAVQSVAMFYGFDVKNDSEELVIASKVFTNALSPSNIDPNNEMASIIGKVMVMTNASLVKQTSKKKWADMVSKGGVPLLLAQMRALAHGAAKNALQKAGKKGLENCLFREVFEQIGKKLSLKTIQKSVPVVSAVLGALIDTAQMKSVLEYADVFYHKRFIMEKESKINNLIGKNDFIVDAEMV